MTILLWSQEELGSFEDEAGGSQEGVPLSEERLAARPSLDDLQGGSSGRVESDRAMNQTQKEAFALPLTTLKEEGGSSQLGEVTIIIALLNLSIDSFFQSKEHGILEEAG